ncbi:MAG: sugar ABC transporter permease [Bacilli bacterium]|jgi:multiple sugar transport system permease protein
MVVQGKNRQKRKTALIGFLFIAPLILYFIVFQLAPIFMSFGISFTEWNWRTPPQFVGFDNYVELFTNRILYPNFWKSLWVTIQYMLMSVPLSVVVTLIVSAMLNSKIKGEKFFKSAFFIPSVTAGVAISAIWMFLIDPTYGVVGAMNRAWGTNINLLRQTTTALPLMAIMAVWSGLGYNVLIMLSAMKNINPSLYEACEIDGGGAIRKFFHVTLPGVAPTILFLCVTSTIGSLQAFDQMYLMTGGGPDGSTTTFMLEIYNMIFSYQEVGTASAMSYILFALILAITLIGQRFLPNAKERKLFTRKVKDGKYLATR